MTTQTPTEPTQAQTLDVKGMTCGGCLRSAQQALSSVPGVERVTIDLSSGRADVEGSAQPDDLIEAVQAIGFEARLADRSGDDAHTQEGRVLLTSFANAAR